MKSELIRLLDAFGYPVFLQGTLNDDEDYPSSFFTFWNFETPEGEFYDNAAHLAAWGFWVYFYSDDPALVESVTKRAENALKENGWTLQGRAIDAASDVKTHTGTMLTCSKIEKY